MDNIGALIVPAALVLFAISIVARGIRIVQQAQTMIIERLGKYHRTLSSGVNLIIPIIDRPRAIDWHQVIVTPAGDDGNDQVDPGGERPMVLAQPLDDHRL